jgi:hypothetical protein
MTWNPRSPTAIPWFYEGVQQADPDAHRWLNELTGASAGLREGYKALAELCGQQFQLDYFDLLEKDKQVNPERHRTADVTERQMLDEWNRLHPENPWRAEDRPLRPSGTTEGQPENFAQIPQWLKSGPKGQMAVGGIVCRALLTQAVSKDSPGGDKERIILYFRNRHLVDAILSFPWKKIYVTYGAAHLPGVTALLKAHDPLWKVKAVKWLRAIRGPERLEGELPPAG